jgi:hypothetical protein
LARLAQKAQDFHGRLTTAKKGLPGQSLGPRTYTRTGFHRFRKGSLQTHFQPFAVLKSDMAGGDEKGISIRIQLFGQV